jgi:hypothetical protein
MTEYVVELKNASYGIRGYKEGKNQKVKYSCTILETDENEHRFLEPDNPESFLTEHGDANGGVVVLHHLGSCRRNSVRALAIVQSPPYGFVCEETETSMYRQFVDAVPVFLDLVADQMLPEAEAALIKKGAV